jgi:hypothetical protein
MSRNYDPQEPLHEGPDGTYITVSQMQFYLNRQHGLKKFQNAHPEFLEYFNLCRVYNLVSDTMDSDPECAIMYWDDKKEVVSFGFPDKGKVARKLSRIRNVKTFIYEDEDDEDDWEMFSQLDWDDDEDE